MYHVMVIVSPCWLLGRVYGILLDVLPIYSRLWKVAPDHPCSTALLFLWCGDVDDVMMVMFAVFTPRLAF